MNAPFAKPRQRLIYNVAPPLADDDIGNVAREAITLKAVTSRLWVMALAILVCLAIGVSYVLVRTPSYTATASVLYNGSVSDENTQSAVRTAADVMDLTTAYYGLLTRESRFKAEADVKSDISFPDELTSASYMPEVQQAMKLENDLFISRMKSMQDGKRTLSQQLQLLKDEAASLEKQVVYAAKQQSLTEDELTAVRRLTERGLTPITRQRDLEATAAALASRKLEVDSELLRSKQKAVETAQRLVDIDTERRTSALDQLQTTRNILQTTRARLQAASLLSSSLSTTKTFDAEQILNQVDLIESDEMADRVVQLLGLRDNDAFLFGEETSNSDNSIDPVQRAQLARAILQQNLVVERVGRGSRLDVKYTSNDATQAFNIATAYASIYTEPSSTKGDRQGAKPSAAASTGKVLRQATVNQIGPGPSKIITAMFVCGAILGSAIAFLLEMRTIMRRTRFARSNVL